MIAYGVAAVLQGVAVGALAVVALRWDRGRRPGRSLLDLLLRFVRSLDAWLLLALLAATGCGSGSTTWSDVSTTWR